jgi:hypothetical protein
MNSPSASNGSFCGGNATDLQSKLPKTLSERSKTEGAAKRATEGISDGYTIALVREVTFTTKAIKTPREILKGLCPLPFKNARFVVRF